MNAALELDSERVQRHWTAGRGRWAGSAGSAGMEAQMLTGKLHRGPALLSLVILIEDTVQ